MTLIQIPRRNIKKITFIIISIFIVSNLIAQDIITTNDGKQIILNSDHTWEEVTEVEVNKIENLNTYRNKLRPNIKASECDILIACELLSQGWKYIMPIPKSSKAAWGVSDGRTTWWNGYWYNSKTKEYSSIKPIKNNKGIYIGDGNNQANTWRNGGSPLKPDNIMYLLSDNGGPLY